MGKKANRKQVDELFRQWKQGRVTTAQVARFLGLDPSFSDFNVAVHLVLQAADGNILAEPLQRFLENPAEALKETPGGIFDSLLAACKLDKVDSRINEKNFPLDDDGTGNREILEYDFGRTVTIVEAEKELAEKGFTPIALKRAMEYVAQNPNDRKNRFLVVLGGSLCFCGTFYRPYFGWNKKRKERFLALDWFSYYPANYRFLVVRDL